MIRTVWKWFWRIVWWLPFFSSPMASAKGVAFDWAVGRVYKALGRGAQAILWAWICIGVIDLLCLIVDLVFALGTSVIHIHQSRASASDHWLNTANLFLFRRGVVQVLLSSLFWVVTGVLFILAGIRAAIFLAAGTRSFRLKSATGLLTFSISAALLVAFVLEVCARLRT